MAMRHSSSANRSPFPSPRGRGRIARRGFANPEPLDSSPRGMRNSLSLRERARVRGKAACNCQGLGALLGAGLCFPSLRVAKFIGSSKARWFEERFFPLTPALSPRRGRIARPALANPELLGSSPRGVRCSLPLRAGWVDGKLEQKCPSSPRPSPPAAGGEGELLALSTVSSLNSTAVIPCPLRPLGRSGARILRPNAL